MFLFAELSPLCPDRPLPSLSQLCEVNGELGRDVVRCAGSCGGVFHLRCAGAPPSAAQFTCAECLAAQPVCFVCRSPAGVLERCRAGRCGKRYHRACLRLFPQAISEAGRLVCPLHVCHTCVSEDPRRLAAQFKPTDKLFKCVRCPTTYHTSESLAWDGECRGGGERVIAFVWPMVNCSGVTALELFCSFLSCYYCDIRLLFASTHSLTLLNLALP